MALHIKFSWKHFPTVQAWDVFVTSGMHILFVFVKIGFVISTVITLITLELLWFIRKVSMVMNLDGKKHIIVAFLVICSHLRTCEDLDYEHLTLNLYGFQGVISYQLTHFRIFGHTLTVSWHFNHHLIIIWYALCIVMFCFWKKLNWGRKNGEGE